MYVPSFSWIVTLKDGSRKTGCIQVDADLLEMREGCLVFMANGIITLTIAYGCWKSACVISQLDGFRDHVEIMDVKADEMVPL